MNRAIARFLTANCHGHLRLHRDSPSDARLNRSWLERARFPRNPVHAAKSRTLVQSNKVLIIGSFEPYVSRGSPPTVLPNVRIRPQYVRGIGDPLGSDGLGGQGASGRGISRPKVEQCVVEGRASTSKKTPLRTNRRDHESLMLPGWHLQGKFKAL